VKKFEQSDPAGSWARLRFAFCDRSRSLRPRLLPVRRPFACRRWAAKAFRRAGAVCGRTILLFAWSLPAILGAGSHPAQPVMAWRPSTCSRLRRLNLHQNPGETLHIRRLENGLERPCGRSRPTPWRFASLVGTDAFAGALTRGSIGTIPATVEIENTQSYQGGVWLGEVDSNQD
jgi:hypothetical protein